MVEGLFFFLAPLLGPMAVAKILAAANLFARLELELEAVDVAVAGAV